MSKVHTYDIEKQKLKKYKDQKYQTIIVSIFIKEAVIFLMTSL